MAWDQLELSLGILSEFVDASRTVGFETHSAVRHRIRSANRRLRIEAAILRERASVAECIKRKQAPGCPKLAASRRAAAAAFYARTFEPCPLGAQTRSCATCGAAFVPTSGVQRRCSVRCRHLSQNGRAIGSGRPGRKHVGTVDVVRGGLHRARVRVGGTRIVLGWFDSESEARAVLRKYAEESLSTPLQI